MGYVEVTGKLDLLQYWPNGDSDVDTASFLPDAGGYLYYAGEGQSGIDVSAFFKTGGSFVEDENNAGEKKFKKIMRPANRLSVRLQGIDAPELHYAPNFREGMFTGDYPEWIAKHLARKKSYRQPYGKLCADFFGDDLKAKLGIPNDAPKEAFRVPAMIRVFADSIHSAVDVYGRVVGYVILTGGEESIVLNDYALAAGFAVCSFYGSMQVDEITRLSSLYANHGSGAAESSIFRSNLSRQLRDFEPELWTTASARDADRDDNGGSFRSKAFDPKLFRRCVDWVGRREALAEPRSLLDFMRENDEPVVLLNDFIAAGGDWSAASKVTMGSLIEQDGAFSYKAGEVIFESRPIVIVDKDSRPLPASFLDPVVES